MNRNNLLFIQIWTLPSSMHYKWKEILDIACKTTNNHKILTKSSIAPRITSKSLGTGHLRNFWKADQLCRGGDAFWQATICSFLQQFKVQRLRRRAMVALSLSVWQHFMVMILHQCWQCSTVCMSLSCNGLLMSSMMIRCFLHLFSWY